MSFSTSSSSDEDELKAKRPRLALTSDSMNKLMSAPMANEWNKENQSQARARAGEQAQPASGSSSAAAKQPLASASAIKKLSPRIPLHMPDSSDSDEADKDSALKPPCLMLNQSSSTPDLAGKKRTSSSDSDDVNMHSASPASSHDGSFLIKRMRGNHLSTPGNMTDKQQKGMTAIGASPDLEAVEMADAAAAAAADSSTPKKGNDKGSSTPLRRYKSSRFVTLKQQKSDAVSAPQLPTFKRSFSTNHAVVKKSLDKAVGSEDHTGDFTRLMALPLFKVGRLTHCKELQTITCDTMAKLLGGGYDDLIDSVRIFDARYPYEYEGGHIKGAENVGMWDEGGENFFKMFLPKEAKPAPVHRSPRKSPQSPRRLDFKVPERAVAKKRERTPTPPQPPRHIVIFHCEFSSARGPALMRALRSRQAKSIFPP